METNISTNNFIVVKSFSKEKTCCVKLFTEGIISLNGFAICQFLEGAELISKTKQSFSNREVELILLMSKKIIVLQNNLPAEIEITYNDLISLRKWLEARMLHCEKERDERTELPNGYPKFNPDTYIGQKHLLLDIRELMIGEVISL